MSKISLSVRDSDLSEIDAQAGGNRTSFMVTAALERARALRRERIDREIEDTNRSDADMHAQEYRAWEGTTGDGIARGLVEILSLNPT